MRYSSGVGGVLAFSTVPKLLVGPVRAIYHVLFMTECVCGILTVVRAGAAALQGFGNLSSLLLVVLLRVIVTVLAMVVMMTLMLMRYAADNVADADTDADVLAFWCILAVLCLCQENASRAARRMELVGGFDRQGNEASAATRGIVIKHAANARLHITLTERYGAKPFQLVDDGCCSPSIPAGGAVACTGIDEPSLQRAEERAACPNLTQPSNAHIINIFLA